MSSTHKKELILDKSVPPIKGYLSLYDVRTPWVPRLAQSLLFTKTQSQIPSHAAVSPFMPDVEGAGAGDIQKEEARVLLLYNVSFLPPLQLVIIKY